MKTRLKIATWNTFWRFENPDLREKAIIHELEKCEPDVICLQEVWEEGGDSLAQRISEHFGMSFAYVGQARDNKVCFGNAILSKFPILSEKSYILPSLEHQVHPRYLLLTTLEFHGGILPVACTHLTWRPFDSCTRQKQVKLIAEKLMDIENKQYMPLLCGDFNAVPTSQEIQMLTGQASSAVEGFSMIDLWEVDQGSEKGFTLTKENPLAKDAFKMNKRVDYIFSQFDASEKAARVLHSKLLGTKPYEGVVASDHYGICMESEWDH